MINTRSKKKYRTKTPGGKTVYHKMKKKQKCILCVDCGAKLNRPRLTLRQTRNLPKTKKRPERPFPGLCSKCMRKKFKEKVR